MTDEKSELEHLRDTLRQVRNSGTELHRMQAALALAVLDGAADPITDNTGRAVRRIINGAADDA